MTTAKKVTQREPVSITWVDIEPDGHEAQCFGRIFCDAAPVRGMKAWWVIEDDAEGEPGTGSPVLVCRASRRHRVGRETEVGRQLFGGPKRWVTKYFPDAGRFVDKGEHYRETAEGSPFARTLQRPSSVSGRAGDAVAETGMMLLHSLCERMAAGEDVDCSVGAAEVGDAAVSAAAAHAASVQ